MKTTLRFDDDRLADIEMAAISITGALLFKDRWTVRASIGVLLDGSVHPDGGAAHPFKPGGLAAAGLEYRVRGNEGMAPAVDLSFLLGVTWTQTEEPDTAEQANYFAADARFGARAMWQIADGIYPYIGARVFGGPVNWELAGEELRGADIHHYQIALGAAARVGKVAIFFEWAGLGERAVSAGVGTAW